MKHLTDEQIARIALHALAKVAESPGQFGRVRCGRAIAVALRDSIPELTLRGSVDVIDAMLELGLLTRTAGSRPMLVATASGHALVRDAGTPAGRTA